MNELDSNPDSEAAEITEADSLSPSIATPVIPELSQLMIALLKGVIYRDDDERLWASLLRLQGQVREQAAILWLDLVLDEAEGHAFLKSRPDANEADGAVRPPRLVARRQLTYAVSLMLALLRKKLAEFDAGGGDTRLILSRDELVELVRIFLPEGPNETRLIDQVDATLNKVIELGFLRRLKPSAGGADGAAFEVRRILKAFVDAQWLAEFDARLETYRSALAGSNSGTGRTGGKESGDE
ncbi:MAG: DUF4194 domain-containing protein [Rhodocyclaceae bacterium]|jgi:hypothetical protein|nr:DUF4194 domain-containing protein [Rhodocyclaceae bacterium]